MNWYKDFSGSPIFEIKCADGITRFLPYELDTIHEYIEAKEDEEKRKNIPGFQRE